MPALVYRRRPLSRRRRPRRFIWTAVGPVTYDKTGSLTAGGLVSGADVFTASETGSLTSQGLLSGTSAAVLQRSFLLRTPFPVIVRSRRRVLR